MTGLRNKFSSTDLETISSSHFWHCCPGHVSLGHPRFNISISKHGGFQWDYYPPESKGPDSCLLSSSSTSSLSSTSLYTCSVMSSSSSIKSLSITGEGQFYSLPLSLFPGSLLILSESCLYHILELPISLEMPATFQLRYL